MDREASFLREQHGLYCLDNLLSNGQLMKRKCLQQKGKGTGNKGIILSVCDQNRHRKPETRSKKPKVPPTVKYSQLMSR